MDKVDLEKTIEVNHFERTISGDSIERANDSRINALTPEEQKKLIWKIDCRLVLTLGFMYCVSLMDRFVCNVPALIRLLTIKQNKLGHCRSSRNGC